MRSPIDRFREIERGRALFNVADDLYFHHAPGAINHTKVRT